MARDDEEMPPRPARARAEGESGERRAGRRQDLVLQPTGPCQNHRLGKYGPGLLPPSSHSVTTPPVRKRHQSITGGAYRWMRTSLPRRPTRGLLATLRFRVPESMAPLGEEAGIGALQQRFSVITASFIPERTNVAASRTSRPRTRAAWILHMQGVTGGIPVVEGRGGNGMRHMR